MDRMRESMFSILGNISGCSFLDLFSGSGIIGIEAVSRGASKIVLVEGDRGKKAVLLKNISFIEGDIKAVIMPAERFINTLSGTFDYIFLDPPFAYKKKERLIALIGKSGAAAGGGIVLMHHPKQDLLEEELYGFQLIDRRKYGGSILSMYQLIDQ